MRVEGPRQIVERILSCGGAVRSYCVQQDSKGRLGLTRCEKNFPGETPLDED